VDLLECSKEGSVAGAQLPALIMSQFTNMVFATTSFQNLSAQRAITMSWISVPYLGLGGVASRVAGISTYYTGSKKDMFRVSYTCSMWKNTRWTNWQWDRWKCGKVRCIPVAMRLWSRLLASPATTASRCKCVCVRRPFWKREISGESWGRLREVGVL
jgi:hypothetical protein